MHERPLAVLAGGHPDRLHRAVAAGVAVAGNVVVDVPAPETVGTVVAVLRAGRRHRDVEATAAAAEAAGTGTAMGQAGPPGNMRARGRRGAGAPRGPRGSALAAV